MDYTICCSTTTVQQLLNQIRPMKTNLFAYLLSLTIIMSTPATQANAPTTAEVQTNFGTFVIELDYANAPKSVVNFVRYAQDGFYEGTIFHRVIDGFMVQGGGYTEDFRRKPTRDPIANEANNGLKNTVGTVAMARTSDPNSATSQFFINVADNNFLDYRSPTLVGWGYTVFGKIVSGMDVVTTIEATPTGGLGPFKKDVPLDTVVIEKVTIQNMLPALEAALNGSAVEPTSPTPPPSTPPADVTPDTDAENDATSSETVETTTSADAEIETLDSEQTTELSTDATARDADTLADTAATATTEAVETTDDSTALNAASDEAVPAPDSPTPPDRAEPPMT